jgi:hypothetical protein
MPPAMLLRLTMLPWPLCHSGSERRYEEERRPDVAGEHLVERGELELCGRAEKRDPGVVDQDVDVAGLARQPLHVGRVGEVGSDEARLPAGSSDLLDRLGTTRGVAAVNHDLRPVPGQLQRDRPTDARRRPGHQRPLPLQVVLTHRRHCRSFLDS